MRVWNVFVLAGLLAGLLAISAGCGTSTPPASPPVTAVPEIAATPLALPAKSTPTRPAAEPITPEATRPLTLTLWVSEEFAPGAERGGDVLQARVAAFERAHPVTVNYVLKAPYGKGGIADWIVQLHELMPDRLPDAAIVDSRELDTLTELGLLQPLNRDLPSGAFWELLSPAQTIARQGGVWSNQPLVLDTEHLVYDTRRLNAPPVSWQDVLTTTASFAFAADSTESFLLHYLHGGGSLNPQEHPASDSGVMQNILDYYQRARANGNLSEATVGMTSAREVMSLFISGQAPLAQVRARDFLSERARLPNAAAASIPTRDGQPAALVSGWTYVILTPDPARRRAATDFLMWLNEPSFLAEWTQAANLAPAGKSAFARSVTPSLYAETLGDLLDHAIVAPGFSAQKSYAAAWHAAVQAVLNGQLTPDDAAFRALQSITQ
jgi:ABC-type glycerol-3-phosphate transport system substrate-binding protein